MSRQNIKRGIGAFFGFVLTMVFGFSLAITDVKAAEATIYLSPTSGNYKVSQNFTVTVFVNSSLQSANAMSANISFTPSELSVVSLSKSGSIISLWAKEPSFSNSSGTISFEGIVLNPGYKGSAGKLISITFRGNANTQADVRITNGSVLANDGQGTELISGLGSASFVIGSNTAQTEEQTPAPSSNTSAPLPKVSSATHPDSEKWYTNSNPTFQWSLPSGVTGVNFFGDQNASTDPGSTSDGLKKTYAYSDVKDGIWYFHIKFKNAAGWGPTTHFKFQIDTVKPSALELAYKDSKLVIKGSDTTSGIDRYDISIDGKEPVSWKDDQSSGAYALSDLAAGEHQALVKAYDKAGNSIEKELKFTSTEILKEQIKEPWSLPFKSILLKTLYILGYILLGLLVILLGKKLINWLAIFFTSTARIISKLTASFGRMLGRSLGASSAIDPEVSALIQQSIESLEQAEQTRKLSHEEQQSLHVLKRALYGSTEKRSSAKEDAVSTKIVAGVFDGENMVGSDGNVYAVPANYASKSKMVEGDQLRLQVQDDGSFVYKQIGPVIRAKKTGILGEQEDGEYVVISEGKAYMVLPASLMYFNAQPGDEVRISVPKGADAKWAALERVLQKAVLVEKQQPAAETKTKKTKKKAKTSE